MAYKPPPPMVTPVFTTPSLSPCLQYVSRPLSPVYCMSLALSLLCMSLYHPVSPLSTVCLYINLSLSSLYSMSLALSRPCMSLYHPLSLLSLQHVSLPLSPLSTVCLSPSLAPVRLYITLSLSPLSLQHVSRPFCVSMCLTMTLYQPRSLLFIQSLSTSLSRSPGKSMRLYRPDASVKASINRHRNIIKH